MSILDKIKNLPNNLIEVLKQASESDDTDIRIEKTISSGVKITIRVRPSAETIDLEGLTLEELTEILEELEKNWISSKPMNRKMKILMRMRNGRIL